MRDHTFEPIRNEEVYTEKTDVHMYGCLLYEIAHGGEHVQR